MEKYDLKELRRYETWLKARIREHEDLAEGESMFGFAAEEGQKCWKKH